jgi:hypothetical protein
MTGVDQSRVIASLRCQVLMRARCALHLPRTGATMGARGLCSACNCHTTRRRERISATGIAAPYARARKTDAEFLRQSSRARIALAAPAAAGTARHQNPIHA